MKKQEWNEALDHLDPALVEEYVTKKMRLGVRAKRKKLGLRIVAIAACLALLAGALTLLPLLRGDEAGGIPSENITGTNATDTNSLTGETPPPTEIVIPSPLQYAEKGDLSKEFVDSNGDAYEIEYEFYSLADVKTYLSGSKSPDDYEVPPKLVTMYDTFPMRYFLDNVPLDEIFANVNHSLDHPTRIYARPSFTVFTYKYEDFACQAYRSDHFQGNTSSDYYTAKTEAYETLTPFGPENIGTFEALSQTLEQDGAGYVTRTVAGYEAVYEYKDHQLQSVTLIVDDCLVIITRATNDEKDSAERFAAFMENEANAAVAPFFSTDEKEYTKALATLVTGIRARTEAGDDFTVEAD